MALVGINYLAAMQRSGGSRHSIGAGNEVTRFFLVRQNEALSFANQMTGTAHPSIAGCYCADIRIDPYPDVAPDTPAPITDPHTETEAYDYLKDHWAIVTCGYATDFSVAGWPTDVPKPSHDAGTQLRLHLRVSSEIIVLPARGVRWDDNDAGTPTGQMPDPESPATRLRVQTGEYLVDWLYVDDPPISDWQDTYQGKVNQTTFMGCPPETLLFEGADVDPDAKFDITDPFCYTCRLVFRRRQITLIGGSSSSSGDEWTLGWNHEYREDGWERVQMYDAAGTLGNRYPLQEFANLFTQ
jgi:hypothetical protein